jgi:hypothetical protein
VKYRTTQRYRTAETRLETGTAGCAVKDTLVGLSEKGATFVTNPPHSIYLIGSIQLGKNNLRDWIPL